MFPDVNVPPASNPAGATPNRQGASPSPTPASGTDDKQQVAFQGVYVPTSDGTSATSVFPDERNPVLVITPYRGDLGLDTGIPHSVYTLNQDEIDTGRLKPLTSTPLRLHPGQSATLDDGSRVEFLGTRRWATVSVRYDPGERIVLVGAVCLLLGLVSMLSGRRRRIWFRVRPSGGDSGAPGDGAGGGAEGASIAEAGALARGEYPGLGTEFETIVAAAKGG